MDIWLLQAGICSPDWNMNAVCLAQLKSSSVLLPAIYMCFTRILHDFIILKIIYTSTRSPVIGSMGGDGGGLCLIAIGGLVLVLCACLRLFLFVVATAAPF